MVNLRLDLTPEYTTDLTSLLPPSLIRRCYVAPDDQQGKNYPRVVTFL